MKGMHWFRYDLRLHDNASLSRLARDCDELLLVYVIDPSWFHQTELESCSMGAPRQQFLSESLIELQRSLSRFGQRLLILQGGPVQVLHSLIGQYKPDVVGVTRVPASYENRQLQKLKQHFPALQWHEEQSFTLFEAEQLPFEPDALPDSFTPFRKRVESIDLKQPQPAPDKLPPPVDIALPQCNADILDNWSSPNSKLRFNGGETAGLQQLHYYLHESGLVSQYKQTRNGLDGWDFSSKLSPWLAQGCLSARRIMAELREYERQHGANDSTYWLYFELLWREYFQWLHFKYQSRLYHERGVRDIDPELHKDLQALLAWKQGKTDSAFVNAFMRQLQQIGWMSNRGRQIVASYLINQLGVDWRYGAAWFEEQLIDYDPASNWGNWQYMAGVGTDPRGRRAFNIDKQQHTYDPLGKFISKYSGF